MCSDKIEEIVENVVDSLCLKSSVQQSQNDSKQYTAAKIVDMYTYWSVLPD